MYNTNDLDMFIRGKNKATEKEMTILSAACDKIFNSISDMVIILDPDFNILRANAHSLKCMHRDNKEVEGNKCFRIFHGRNCKNPIEECPFKRLIRTKKSETLEYYNQELKRHWLITVDPIIKDAKIIGSIHFLKDITEKKKEEEKIIDKLDDMNKELNKLYNLMAGREVKMAELKKSIRNLEKRRK